MCSVIVSLFRLFGPVFLFAISLCINAGIHRVQQTEFEFTDEDIRNFGCSYCDCFSDITMKDVNGLYVCQQCAGKIKSIINDSKLQGRQKRNYGSLENEPNLSFQDRPEVSERVRGLLEINRKEYRQKSSIFCCTGNTEQRQLLSEGAPDQQDLKLKCKDCNRMISYQELECHARGHIVACECGYLPPENLLVKQRLEQLTEHQKERRKCTFCDQTVPCAEKKEHELICGMRLVECPVCCATLTNDDLISHVSKMSQIQNYQNVSCSVCRVTLPAVNYAFHFRKYHSPKYTLASLSADDCPYCSDIEGLVSEKELLAHVASQHTDNYVDLAGMTPEDLEKAGEQFVLLRNRMQMAEDRFNLSLMYPIPASSARSAVVPVSDDVSSRLNQLQNALASTHDGAFLWCVHDAKKRIREAKEGRVTSIYSPPFYSGRNGYKMAIRAYLDGDGAGYKKCLSIFFVLMKGEYDPLLKWPFEVKVSLILVDQSQHWDKRHIVQTFKPTDSSSFQRPETDMNIASGCPEFCTLDKLEDERYVKGDVIYIKCIVDAAKIYHP